MVLKVCQGMRLEVEVQVSAVKDGVSVLVSSDNLSNCPRAVSGLAGKQQMNMRGMTPQMLASQQMLAVLNQQGLSVSGVKGLNSMMLGNNVGKSGSVTIQVSVIL